MTDNIWAIVLAAGKSSRMRRPKMLIPIRGKTMIETVIDNVLKSSVKKIVVVLGAYSNDIARQIKHLPVITCFNENYTKGMLSSVQCGLSFLPQNYKAAFIIPGDQPMIEPKVIDNMILSYRNNQKGIIIPVYKGERGHPVLIDRKYRIAIDDLDESRGLRMLSEIYAEDVLEMETDSPGILKDFDNETDFQDEIIN